MENTRPLSYKITRHFILYFFCTIYFSLNRTYVFFFCLKVSTERYIRHELLAATEQFLSQTLPWWRTLLPSLKRETHHKAAFHSKVKRYFGLMFENVTVLGLSCPYRECLWTGWWRSCCGRSCSRPRGTRRRPPSSCSCWRRRCRRSERI